MAAHRTRGLVALALVAFSAAGGTAERGAASAPWRLVYATEVEGRRGLDVYVVDVPGGKPRRVAGVTARDDFTPTWSPDGRTIAFRRNPARGDEGEILSVSAGAGGLGT
jgi:dipeptidyl aminopeptidase/acylaminoacyl peptidase